MDLKFIFLIAKDYRIHRNQGRYLDGNPLFHVCGVLFGEEGCGGGGALASPVDKITNTTRSRCAPTTQYFDAPDYNLLDIISTNSVSNAVKYI